jgi:tetratricopeptide (TPR) repeat protein
MRRSILLVVFAALVPAAAFAAGKESAKEHYLRANALYDERDLDHAMVEYNSAIALHPRFLRAYQRRALAWYALGAHELAIEDCNRAIEIQPLDAWSHRMRGDAWFAMRNLGRAIADYTAALRIEPDSAAVYFQRAEAHRAMENYEAAVRDYRRAVDGDSGLVFGYREWGNLRPLLAKAREAEKRLRASAGLALRPRPAAMRRPSGPAAESR